MSSTAAVSPNLFVTWSSRRWTAPASRGGGALGLGTGGSEGDPAAREERDAAEREDRHTDVGDGERRRAPPVQVIHELEDADGRHSRPRREEEDDDRQRRDGPYKGRDESDADRSAEHWDQHIAEAAQARCAEARRGLVHRAVDL